MSVDLKSDSPTPESAEARADYWCMKAQEQHRACEALIEASEPLDAAIEFEEIEGVGDDYRCEIVLSLRELRRFRAALAAARGDA